MAPISNNPSLIESLRYSAGTDRILSIPGGRGRNRSAYKRNFVQDVKNNIVSEKPDAYSNVAAYYKYKFNTPASRILNTGQTFNKIEKPYYNSGSKTSKSPSGQAGTSSPRNYNIYEDAKGYYIVSTPKQSKSGSSSKSSRNNPMKRKLEQTYHTGNDNPAGSLVNLIYY